MLRQLCYYKMELLVSSEDDWQDWTVEQTVSCIIWEQNVIHPGPVLVYLTGVVQNKSVNATGRKNYVYVLVLCIV